jgi:thiamine-monophosphate kinase
VIAGHARCALDLSDGLLADLGHICQRSGVGARVEAARLPLSDSMRQHIDRHHDWTPALSGGEDYELCFTLSPAGERALREHYPEALAPYTCVGEIVPGQGVACTLPDGQGFNQGAGYDHFR